MSRRDLAFLCLGVLAGLIAGAAIRPGPATTPPRPKEAASPKPSAPEFGVEAGKAYDVYCSFPRQGPTVYRGCTILGFTTRGLGLSEDLASGSRGSSGFLSSGNYGDRRYFEQWLALGLADGRRAYIPASAVESIEEARGDGP